MNEKPRLIVCMGVSGVGKSTLAIHLANGLGWQYLEADDHHPEENRQLMARGQPLTDAHRQPWMVSIEAALRETATRGEHCVMAHSALRRSHRERLRQCGLRTAFVHLIADPADIERRMAHRKGHFMPASLLQSQYDSLQNPDGEPDVLPLDANRSAGATETEAVRLLSPFLSDEVYP